MVEPIINLYRTKTEAFYFKNSQRNSFYNFDGVQLLPNNEVAYVQVTNTPNGIQVEDWSVKMIGLCSGVAQNISEYFKIEKLTNSVNGDPQFYWSILNVPFDFGDEMVYLEVSQTLGETFYSNPFLFTEEDSELTTMFHYKDRKLEEFQSIGFKTWFREDDYKEERETYYELSTQNTVTHAVKQHELDIYHTEKFAKSQLIQLAKVLGCSQLYVNLVRAYLYEPLDIPKMALQENYTKVPSYALSFNRSDIYNPSSGQLTTPDYDNQDYNSSDYYTGGNTPTPAPLRKHNSKFNIKFN